MNRDEWERGSGTGGHALCVYREYSRMRIGVYIWWLGADESIHLISRPDLNVSISSLDAIRLRRSYRNYPLSLIIDRRRILNHGRFFGFEHQGLLDVFRYGFRVVCRGDGFRAGRSHAEEGVVDGDGLDPRPRQPEVQGGTRPF